VIPVPLRRDEVKESSLSQGRHIKRGVADSRERVMRESEAAGRGSEANPLFMCRPWLKEDSISQHDESDGVSLILA
jgi:hypothetical protein